ncbi:ribonuclease H-like protein [Pseudovirgaria hyperparasitica]|uniref:Ribonuclease H-like protein n=1 Tax=Pseudovirgaria hyperparasitica TaxID=470096 RepID=A0A6A6WDU0_9PEZI|nr:ribonuclease H-like protein [Pseudovirgaria hyperparasitica]KAF2759727.1 ribonuclease H-like protein [Pseudovirgaria hyperparasitica]
MAVKKAASKLLKKAPTLTNVNLASLCGLLGLAKSGPKPALTDRFEAGMTQPRIQWKNNCARILSIDMGIKNLAYCIVDVKLESLTQPTISLQVEKWQRFDLTKLEGASTVSTTENKSALPGQESVPDDIFYPPSLATRAYDLLKNQLLPNEPSIVLIERQHFRQANGSAVQEWTIRVNMLESMLWAVLETLNRESGSGKALPRFNAFPVAPKAVGQFWVDSSTCQTESTCAEVGKARKKKKIEKKDKIAVVREWFSADTYVYFIPPRKSESSMTVNEPIEITFSKQAERVRNAFCAGARRKKKLDDSEVTDPDLDMTKKDDLADCFLQAAAWVAWEQNRLKIDNLVKQGVDRTSLLPTLITCS